MCDYSASNIPSRNWKREDVEMSKDVAHERLLDELHAIYVEKNQKYGDSFGISVKKYGMISALTRISDKFNRLESLILNNDEGTNDESLEDTLLDLANYCIMTVMELDEERD